MSKMHWLLIVLSVLAAIATAQKPQYETYGCNIATVTLTCNHNRDDAFIVDWIITGDAGSGAVISQQTGQDPVIRSDYQNGSLELDFNSGNLNMTVMPGFDRSYTCRVRLDSPPVFSEIADNRLVIANCTSLSGVEATVSNEPILNDGSSKWGTHTKRTLVCQATSDPPPTITVVKDGEDLPDTPNCEPFNDVTKCTLTKILDKSEFDMGTYRMAIRINFDPPMNITPLAIVYPFRFEKEMSIGPLLACILVPIAILTSVAVVAFVLYGINRGTVKPVSTISKSPEDPKEGSTITFTCETTKARPADIISYTWWHNGEQIPNEIGKTLTLTLNRSDNGSYQCSATNEAGEGEKSNAEYLEVLFKPVSTISKSPEDPKEGSTITFTCEAKANPTDIISYAWWYNGTRMPGKTGKTLTLTLKRGYNGIYQCSAANKVGEGEMSNAEDLKVWYRPVSTIIVLIKKEDNEERSPYRLRCDTKAWPQPEPNKYTWWHNGDLIKGETQRFLNRQLIKKHDGSYECSATNKVGEGKKSDAKDVKEWCNRVSTNTPDNKLEGNATNKVGQEVGSQNQV